MAQDYKRRQKSAPSKSASGLPAWFWLFTGIVSGLFIAFLVYLSSLQVKPSKDTSPQIDEEQKTEGSQLSEQIKEQANRLREGKEALKKPTFTFYKRLPELVIDTPKPKPQSERQENQQPRKAYMLQAGSFRSFQDADSLKAALIMHGLEVEIDTAADQKGGEWHRVRVGPYTSQNKLNKAQDVLANNNIPSMLLEVK